jgi:hypothetical protein
MARTPTTSLHTLKCNWITQRNFPSVAWHTRPRRCQALSCPVGRAVANTVSWLVCSISTCQSLHGEGWKSSSPLLPLPAYRKDPMVVITRDLFCRPPLSLPPLVSSTVHRAPLCPAFPSSSPEFGPRRMAASTLPSALAGGSSDLSSIANRSVVRCTPP